MSGMLLQVGYIFTEMAFLMILVQMSPQIIFIKEVELTESTEWVKEYDRSLVISYTLLYMLLKFLLGVQDLFIEGCYFMLEAIDALYLYLLNCVEYQ